MYLPPDEASGQLLSSKRADSESDLATDGGEDVFLIEAQLREGDRLRFSALFREVLKAFKVRVLVRALPPLPSKVLSSRVTAARSRCACILGRGQESRAVTRTSRWFVGDKMSTAQLEPCAPRRLFRLGTSSES